MIFGADRVKGAIDSRHLLLFLFVWLGIRSRSKLLVTSVSRDRRSHPRLFLCLARH